MAKKKVTSCTVFNDIVGMRMCIVYSEIDIETGTIISDNKRKDIIVTDPSAEKEISDLMEYANGFLEGEK